jgi:hypothetical protein
MDGDRKKLHDWLDDWFDNLLRLGPRLEDGDEHVIIISGGVVAEDEQGAPVTDFTVTTTRTRHL